MVSYFAEDWQETAAFEATIDSEKETLREIRCCLNSEQCDLSKKRQEATDCSQYVAETSDERALLGAELFVVRKSGDNRGRRHEGDMGSGKSRQKVVQVVFKPLIDLLHTAERFGR